MYILSKSAHNEIYVDHTIIQFPFLSHKIIWKGQAMSVMFGKMEKVFNNILEFKIQSPAITPNRNLLIIIYSNTPIALIRSVNMNG